MPLSRSFTLLFALTAATAAFTSITTLFGSASGVAHAAATAACACLAGTTLGTLPAAAAVVFPEAHRGPEKAAAFVGGVAVVAAGVAVVTGAGVGAGIAELLPVGGGWLLGGLLGGGGALLAASAGRAARDLGGRGGAAVLAVAVLSGAGVASLWTWVEPYVLGGCVFVAGGVTRPASCRTRPASAPLGGRVSATVGRHLWRHSAGARAIVFDHAGVSLALRRCPRPARRC